MRHQDVPSQAHRAQYRVVLVLTHSIPRCANSGMLSSWHGSSPAPSSELPPNIGGDSAGKRAVRTSRLTSVERSHARRRSLGGAPSRAIPRLGARSVLCQSWRHSVPLKSQGETRARPGGRNSAPACRIPRAELDAKSSSAAWPVLNAGRQTRKRPVSPILGAKTAGVSSGVLDLKGQHGGCLVLAHTVVILRSLLHSAFGED